jgi:hypothetical protein
MESENQQKIPAREFVYYPTVWQVSNMLMCKKYILEKSCYIAAAFYQIYNENTLL